PFIAHGLERHDVVDPREIRLESAQIFALDSIAREERRLHRAHRHGLRGLDGTDDDVGGPQGLNVAEGRLFVALADRDHHDHRRHAKNDSKAGQHAAQLVQPKVLEAQSKCFKQECHARLTIILHAGASLVAQVEIISDGEDPKGWMFETQILDDGGLLSKHQLTLSWADYNLLSPDGGDEPAKG